MATQFGLVKLDGVRLADLATIGLYSTDATAPGREVLVGLDPAACEVDGGVLIAQGTTDIAQENQAQALALGTRVVAVGVATVDNTYVLSVYDRGGVVRHVVDTLEERSFEVGDPLPEEEGLARMTEHSALRVFRKLTGVSLQGALEAEFTVLRPAQEHDEPGPRPWWRQLLGLRTDKEGYADKTGPPVLDPADER